jgi:hypothetical protein
VRSPFERSVESAIQRGVNVLLQQQDKDGFWREFELQPGASESWATAWVAWCLSGRAGRGWQMPVRASCRRAAAVVWHARTNGGWGYNRGTGPDADTTSWVLRFLCACGSRVEPLPYLAPYIDAGGGVHTFRELGFGAWTDAHDDVAANAGLALLTAGPRAPAVDRIRRHLTRRFPGETYWWSTPTYGVAWTLRFLSASGGLPPAVRTTAQAWIANLPESSSSFEVAHRLMAVLDLYRVKAAAVPLVNLLLDLCGPDGWPGSSFLLVPPRDMGAAAAPNPELRALLTTSLCVRMLSEWAASPSSVS